MSWPGRSFEPAQRMELVYCHKCENEWYKDGNNGLTCPNCHSDFTEIIEQDFDPRAAQEPENPFHSHNPWATADDPAEEDIENIGADQFGARGGYGAGDHQQQPFGQQQQSFQHPIMNDFTSMMQNITGARGAPSGFFPFAQSGVQDDGQFSPRSAPGIRQDGSQTRVVHETGPNGGIRITYTSGPGYQFTTRTSGNGFLTGGNHNGAAPVGEMNDIIQSIFGGMFPGAQAGGARGPVGAMNPFSAMLSTMFDPSNARHGDAVFSQEALDRVISQLMEQNPGGSAPGPAAPSAIQALPRKRLSVDMLDENTGQAECSICMDNVEVGDEVATLPCGHWFHFTCVEAWLKEHDTCPVCRRGIMAKEGPRDRVRTPGQAPLHDEDPFELGRRQSGTREHPFTVDESPSRERRRRRPSEHRHSSGGMDGGGASSGAGITDRMRNFFGGGPGGPGGGGAGAGGGGPPGNNSGNGGRNPQEYWRR